MYKKGQIFRDIHSNELVKLARIYTKNKPFGNDFKMVYITGEYIGEGYLCKEIELTDKFEIVKSGLPEALYSND